MSDVSGMNSNPNRDRGRPFWLLAGIVFLLTQTPAQAQLWSNPTLAASVVNPGGPAQLVYAPGDTFWLISSAEDTLSGVEQMRAYWDAGDSWRGPVIFCDTGRDFWCSGQAALDPQGRVWAAWSGVIPDEWYPFWSNGTVWYAFRDSSGWHSPDSADYGLNCGPRDMNFTSDRNGNWYLGWSYDGGMGTQGFSGGDYQWWLGSQWSTGVDIGASRFGTYYGALLLSPDPDSGLWAVMSYYIYDSTELQVYRLLAGADSLRFLFPITSSAVSYGIATDSNGRVWITYLRDTALCWVGIEHEQIVDSGLVYAPVAGNILTAVDLHGVIWTAWRHGSAIWASYNRGLGWTEPEVVVDSSSSLDCIAFDGKGLPHVAFERTDGIYVTQRLSPVGVAECRPVPERGISVRLLSPNPFAGTARVELQVGASARVNLRVRDITGRTIAVLEDGAMTPGTYRRDWHAAAGVPNGVYFLNFAAGSHREVRKLVLAR